MDNSRGRQREHKCGISLGPMKFRKTPLHLKSEVLGNESQTPSEMFYRYQSLMIAFA